MGDKGDKEDKGDSETRRRREIGEICTLTNSQTTNNKQQITNDK